MASLYMNLQAQTPNAGEVSEREKKIIGFVLHFTVIILPSPPGQNP